METSFRFLNQIRLLLLGVAGAALSSMLLATTVEAASNTDFIELKVRMDPEGLGSDKWLLRIFNIDDQALQVGKVYNAKTEKAGNAAVKLPSEMFAMPLVISAFTKCSKKDQGECHNFEIFVPPNCHTETIWTAGPLEDALWRYYRRSASRGAEAWSPGQVSCSSWLENLDDLALTNGVIEDGYWLEDETLVEALQENQHLLVSTRSPICLAERRHNGGGLERANEIPVGEFEYTIGGTENVLEDEVRVNSDGGVSNICGIEFDGKLEVNTTTFSPADRFVLDSADFDGVVFDHHSIDYDLDLTSYIVRHTNGRGLDHPDFDDVCSATTLIEFTNTDDDEQDVSAGTGVTFTDLFDAGPDTSVYLTSDGDEVIDDSDVWAILYSANDDWNEARVITISLLGHRQEDFRDNLHIQLDGSADELFIGLRADYELNEEEVDGDRAFMGYTMTVWDNSSDEGRQAIRRNFLNCYQVADEWARQYFDVPGFGQPISPFVAAEAAARSQCFSNSRSQQNWQTAEVGSWMMNAHRGVSPNLAVNPGWLAPHLDYEIYISKFEEVVFQGPKTIKRTDESGQLLTAIPTLVEGDRVRLKPEDDCCDDYDLVISCDAVFNGFP